jgi:PIN domain nuclease of toxin-antitoxin system
MASPTVTNIHEAKTHLSRLVDRAASIWELAIKAASGKLRMPKELVEQVQESGYMSLPVTAAHAIAAAELPLHHRDPFDRMLIAQASLESLTLLTADPRLKLYGVRIMLA